MGSKQSSAQQLSWAVKELSSELYDAFYKTTAGKSNKNIIFSPFQLYTTLYILYLAAEGHTKQEVRELLRLDKIRDSCAENASSQLLRAMKLNDQTKGFGIKMISSLFVTNIYNDNIFDKFRKALSLFGDMYEIQLIDFGHGLAKYMVDNWAKKCTNEFICSATDRDCLTSPMFHVDLFRLVDRLNVESAHAHEMIFHDSSNNATNTTVTRFIGRFMYIHDVTNKIRVTEFTFKSNPDISALIVLPEKRNEIIRPEFPKLLKEEINTWLDSLTIESELEVFLPSIKFISTLHIGTVLQNDKTPTMFSDSADFSGMAPLTTTPLFLSSLHASCYVDISVEIQGHKIQDMDNEIYQDISRDTFRVDHPFMVIIVHRTTKTLLLIAHVENIGVTDV